MYTGHRALSWGGHASPWGRGHVELGAKKLYRLLQWVWPVRDLRKIAC